MGSHGYSHANGHRWLFLLLAALSVVTSAAAQDSSDGFLNIDCGKPKDYNYTDSKTNLFYTSDHQYVSTGEMNKVSNLQLAYSVQTQDLRSFPNGMRNCYTLPVNPKTTYLLRAWFMHGNYDKSNQLPQFALHAGVNHWYTVNISSAFSNTFVDLVFVGDDRGSLDLCLVNTRNGTPFVSALELRPLPNKMYPANSFRALALTSRTNFGATTTVRYPKDKYDRLWTEFTPAGWTPLTTTSSSPVLAEVLSTAVYPTTGSKLGFTYPMAADVAMTEESGFIFLQIAEVQQLKVNEFREFNITFNDMKWWDRVVPKHEGTILSTIDPQKATRLHIVLEQTSDSTLPPIINAAEVYLVRNMTGVETAQQDESALKAIKAAYTVQKNWQGDPCSPASTFMWEGLNCSSDGSNSFRIISLNLASSGLTGTISEAIGNLTQLQSLDLSRNNLTGAIPTLFANLTQLTFLDLSGNNFDGSVPQALLDRSTAGKLTLKVGSNSDSCNDSASCENKKKSTAKVVAVVAASMVSIIIFALITVVVIKTRKQKLPERQENLDGRYNSGGQKKQQNSFFRSASLEMESKQFSHADLERITGNFHKEIGRGGFGPVYYGVLHNNVEVAVKLLCKSSSQGPKEFKNEAHILTRIHHKNLVSFVGYSNDDNNNLALLYEYMAEGSLHDHLRGRSTQFNSPLNWITRLRIAIEAAQGLEYLHHGCNPSIVHRDVKTNNILLNKNLEAKIADFGLSKNFEKDTYTHVSTKVMGTTGYLDPEYYITSKLTEKSDVYSFGIVLLELITGHPAIITNNENINIVQWVQKKLRQGDIGEVVDERLQGEYDINSAWKATETALACIPLDSTQRPNMSEVLSLLKDCLQLERGNAQIQTTHKFDEDIVNSSASVRLLATDMTTMCNPVAR